MQKKISISHNNRTLLFKPLQKDHLLYWMPYSSGKPGEALQHGTVVDLERTTGLAIRTGIAGTEVDESIATDKPRLLL